MAKMKKVMKNVLELYAKTIKEKGWKAGEPLIWAYAVRIGLRSLELLAEDKKKPCCGHKD